MGRWQFAGMAAFLAAAFFSAPAYSSPGASGAPSRQVRATVEGIQNIMQDPRLQNDARKKERRARLKQLIVRRFDFADMARRALGPNWQGRTAKERADFVKVFGDLLEDAYLDQIELYGADSFAYLRESRDGDFAEVNTKAMGIRGDELAIDYKLRARGGDWKVYDLVVENVSVVNNYRSQFNRILNGESFGALLKKLRATRSTQVQARMTRPDSTVFSYWLLAQAAPNRPR